MPWVCLDGGAGCAIRDEESMLKRPNCAQKYSEKMLVLGARTEDERHTLGMCSKKIMVNSGSVCKMGRIHRAVCTGSFFYFLPAPGKSHPPGLGLVDLGQP